MRSASGGLAVLFDGYWAVDGPPSGRNVLQSLVRGWSESFPADEVTVALPSFADLSAETLGELFGDNVSIELVRAPVKNHGVWVTTALRRIASRFDVILTQNFAPIFVGKSTTVVVFLHDALFVVHPQWFTPLERMYLGAIRPTLGQADVVLTSSKAEAARISSVWPRVGRKTAPIGLGVPYGLSVATAQKPSGLGTVDRPYILSVGRLNVRKNIANLIAAFESDDDISKGYDLVIVGAADGKHNPSLQSDNMESVKFTGHVTDAELKWLYLHAELFVFPSLDEGFGLPLLEARTFGTNTVASDIAPFREIGGSVAFFDPTSTSSIAAGIKVGLSSRRMVSTNILAFDADVIWRDVAHAARAATVDSIRNRKGK